MKTLKTPNYSKIYQSITTFRWPRRYHLTVSMVQSGMHTFATMTFWLLKQLLQVVSLLFVGLSVLLINILISCLRLITKTTLLQVIRTRCTLFLTNLLIRSIQTEKRLKRLCPSSTLWLEIKLNHLWTSVIRTCINM